MVLTYSLAINELERVVMVWVAINIWFGASSLRFMARMSHGWRLSFPALA